MSSDLKNLTEKTAKLSIDPIYDTNWCDMPAEIKLECIGKMKFKERLSLRCTAKAEKSLVESQKMIFLQGAFHGDWGYVECDENLYVSPPLTRKPCFLKPFDDTCTSLEGILKLGVFERFSIFPLDPYVKQGLMNYTGRISAKNVKFSDCDNETVVAVLQKMNKEVQMIMIHCNIEFDYNFDEILAIPQVQNANYWRIIHYTQTDSLHKIAQMWIDKNSKVGSTFRVSSYYESGESFKNFREHFSDSVVSINKKRVRIRTKNPDRHILLERQLDQFAQIDYCPQSYSLILISAEMKESEYDGDRVKWICKMAQWYDEVVLEYTY